MAAKSDCIPLVIQARQGDQEALNALAHAVRGPLGEYIQRMTLDEDITQDLLQDSLLTMVHQFATLRDPDSFWPWLTRIALNNVRSHYRTTWRKQKGQDQVSQTHITAHKVQDTLGEVIGNEIKQIVVTALGALTPEHRVVITLRCYEQLTFPQIASLLGCSEFKARSLFYRAQKALGKNLTRSGLGKGFMIGALIIFGKLNASSETAAAGVTVTAASLQVGFWPTLAGGLTGKALLSGAAAIVVAVSVHPLLTALPVFSRPLYTDVALADSRPSPVAEQHTWYHYPANYPGTVFIRTRATQPGQKPTWQCVQNEDGNYLRSDQGIAMRNAHLWHADLSVWRLPTDPPALRRFLDEVEGRQTQSHRVKPTRSDLLVIQGTGDDGQEIHERTIPGFDVTDEEFFVHPWPSGTRRVDTRDALHRQGWGYFRLSGQLSGRAIHGIGRLPLVPARYREYGPRLQLSVGESLIAEDGSTGAWAGSGGGGPRKRYPAGHFFNGLSRPWMGLHSLDTVRRDAARYGLPFDTHPHEDRDTTHVTVSVTDRNLRFDYEIDMERDLVAGIGCFRSGLPCGHIQIEYLESLASDEELSWESRTPDRHRQPPQGLKCWWLTELIRGAWRDAEANP